MNDPSDAGRAEVRRHNRMRCAALGCSLGEVIDLTAAGMRVSRRGSMRVGVGEPVAITLALASSEVALNGRIVWHRRIGFRRHEIGIEFIAVDAQTRECLSDLARCAARMAGWPAQAA